MVLTFIGIKEIFYDISFIKGIAIASILETNIAKVVPLVEDAIDLHIKQTVLISSMDLKISFNEDIL